MPTYNPRPLYDTDGKARGILAAGQGIAAGIMQIGNNRREDKQRMEERGWRVEDRDFAAAHDSEMWDKRQRAEEADRAAEKQAREDERQRKREEEENAVLGAMAGLSAAAPQLFSETELQTYSKLKPSALRGVLQVKQAELGQWLKDEHDKRQAENDRQTFPLNDPGSGEPIPGVAITGNGQVVRFGGKDPAFTEEELKNMKLEPKSAKVRGVTWERREPESLGSVPVQTDKGTFKGFEQLPPGWDIDPATNKPVKIPAGMSMLAWRELQARKARQQGTPAANGGTRSRLDELNDRISAVK